MTSSRKCPLKSFKFVDAEGEIDPEITVDTSLNIVVKTDKPFQKALKMVGIMPKSLMDGKCNEIITEKSFPLTLEVCGLEKIKKTAVDAVIDFVVGQKPSEVTFGGLKIKGLFENSSKTCPITKYQITTTENGEEAPAADKIWKYVKFDKTTAELKILNSALAASKIDFYV